MRGKVVCCVGSFAFPQSEGLPPTAAGGIGGVGKKDQLLFICIFGASCCPRPPLFPKTPGAVAPAGKSIAHCINGHAWTNRRKLTALVNLSPFHFALQRREEGKKLGDVATFSSSAIIVLVWKKTLHDEERGGGVIIRTSIQTLLFFHSYMQVRAKKEEKLRFCYEH